MAKTGKESKKTAPMAAVPTRVAPIHRRARSAARREKLIDSTREEIKEAAMRQIAERGVPALSLRAIARDIGLTAPALYRYFPDRDALVTALVQDAFASFAEALDAAFSSRPAEDHRGRFFAASKAYRDWALAHPQRYVLIFGTPVPGYVRTDKTETVSDKSFGILVKGLDDAVKAGCLRPGDTIPAMPEGLAARLAFLGNASTPPFPDEVLYLALSTWSRIHGLVSLEIYGLLPGFLSDQVEGFFDSEIKRSMEQLGLESKGEKE